MEFNKNTPSSCSSFCSVCVFSHVCLVSISRGPVLQLHHRSDTNQSSCYGRQTRNKLRLDPSVFSDHHDVIVCVLFSLESAVQTLLQPHDCAVVAALRQLQDLQLCCCCCAADLLDLLKVSERDSEVVRNQTSSYPEGGVCVVKPALQNLSQ